MIELNPEQEAALRQIMAAYEPGECHLLTGHAGTGKTTLMQRLAQEMKSHGREVVLTAPTHKAVAVLSEKIHEAGIKGVPCRTIQSLLGLKARPKSDQLVFERPKNAEAVTADLVVVDECSMVGEDLLRHIGRYLPEAFVLFVGDKAQLPPIGEVESQTFRTGSQSHLSTIIRQAADNPILDAAHAIRATQGTDSMDWSWCKSAKLGNTGIFLPRSSADEWLRKAFTSPAFDKDPNLHRYLAWTNQRVSDVNAKIRRWRYGENVTTPFVVGERALLRSPVIQDKTVLFNTNDEVKVLSIEQSNHRSRFKESAQLSAWTAEIETWKMKVQSDDGRKGTIHIASDNRTYNKVLDRLRDEAGHVRTRWKQFHDFQASLAQAQSIYALTTHCAEGSSFQNVFLDVADIRRRERDNLLEFQQMLYVAATRPSKALMLLGV